MAILSLPSAAPSGPITKAIRVWPWRDYAVYYTAFRSTEWQAAGVEMVNDGIRLANHATMILNDD
jgi:hypothetical protein